MPDIRIELGNGLKMQIGGCDVSSLVQRYYLEQDKQGESELHVVFSTDMLQVSGCADHVTEVAIAEEKKAELEAEAQIQPGSLAHVRARVTNLEAITTLITKVLLASYDSEPLDTAALLRRLLLEA